MNAALSAGSRRVIVKVGSALLVDPDTLEIRRDWLCDLAADLARCRARGQQVLVVSSGAVAIGRVRLGLGARQPCGSKENRPPPLSARSISRPCRGRDAPTRRYRRPGAADAGGHRDRRRHLNGRATLEQLLDLGVMPVINENDTVATAEIRFGDNDRLAARVAQMASADALVLLSDIDGLYSADPRRHPDATHYPEITELTPEIEAMAGPR